MVADLRADPAREVNAYMNLGSGFGAFAGSLAGDEIREKKEYEKLYLESANERLISVLSYASAEGWDKERTHSEIININKWAQTKAGERYAFDVSRQNRKDQSKGNAGITEQFDFWNKDLSGALQDTSFENPEEDPRVIRARRQLESATKMFAGQSPDGGVPAPTPAPTEGSDKLAGTEPVQEEKIDAITRADTPINKADKDIEAELPATEPYPNPNRSVRTAVDAMSSGEQADQLAKAKKALDEGNLPRPKTKAEHDKLKPGEQYLDPDGIVRTKK